MNHVNAAIATHADVKIGGKKYAVDMIAPDLALSSYTGNRVHYADLKVDVRRFR